MKDIKNFLEELAAPSNTIGMGNPNPASENSSEPLPKSKKKKFKKYKISKKSEEE